MTTASSSRTFPGSHSGVTLGPLWGRIAAAELLDGTLDPRLAPYRPTRFL